MAEISGKGAKDTRRKWRRRKRRHLGGLGPVRPPHEARHRLHQGPVTPGYQHLQQVQVQVRVQVRVQVQVWVQVQVQVQVQVWVLVRRQVKKLPGGEGAGVGEAAQWLALGAC